MRAALFWVYGAACSGNSLPTFRDNGLIFKGQESKNWILDPVLPQKSEFLDILRCLGCKYADPFFFWNALSCLVCGYLHFGGTYCLSLQHRVWKVGDTFVVGLPNRSYHFISIHS
jgi:hypothetical protein